MVVTAAAFDVK